MSSIASGAAALAAPQTLTASELEQARLFLEQSRNGVIGAIKGLSEAQWKHNPASDRWSIAENVEHIVTVLERVAGPIREQMAAAPALCAGLGRHRDGRSGRGSGCVRLYRSTASEGRHCPD